VIHEGPTDVTGVRKDLTGISGISSQPDASKGTLCPRCKSGYINPIGPDNEMIQKRQCHNCGYVMSGFNGAWLVTVLIMGLVFLGCIGYFSKGCS
jgi:hypothetical protein